MKTTICAGTLVTYNFFYPYLDEYTEQDFKYATHWCDIHPSLSDSYVCKDIKRQLYVTMFENQMYNSYKKRNKKQ